MKLALFLLVIIIAAQAGEKGGDQIHWNSNSCFHRGYEYRGGYYSNDFDLPHVKGVHACDARTALDELKLKQQYDEYKLRVATLVSKMLQETSCDPIRNLLQEYKDNVQRHDANVIANINKRFRLFESTKKEFEIQRWFALMAAYNVTCSGEEHGKETFIDMEMINKLLAPRVPKKVKVHKDGDNIKDCSNVEARGEDDLKGFTISLENAEGDFFNFYSDVYGVADQVVIKSVAGDILYDTGCVPHGKEKGFVKVPMPKGEKKIVVNIVNTCLDPKNKSGSMWELALQCKEKEELDSGVLAACIDARAELIKLLIERVEHIKGLLAAEAHQLKCLFHLDDYIRTKLVGGHYLVLGEPNRINDICEISNEECEIRRRMKRQKEDLVPDSHFNHYRPGREARSPSAETLLDDRSCGSRPDDRGSVLQVISWSYCVNARDRLMEVSP